MARKGILFDPLLRSNYTTATILHQTAGLQTSDPKSTDLFLPRNTNHPSL